MASKIQQQSNIAEDDVLDVLSEYSLQELEENLFEIFLRTTDVDPSDSGLLSDFTSIASDKDASQIKNSLFACSVEEVSLGSILRVFELAVPETERETNGVYYTPEEVVQYIVHKGVSGDDLVCDCACGAGAFLVEATERIHELTSHSVRQVVNNNIYGVDVSQSSIRESKMLLSLLAATNGEVLDHGDFNLYQGDSLRLSWRETFPSVFDEDGFDVVVGNPPYVNIQTMSDETKDYVLREYNTVQSGNFNTYIPFTELGINLINDRGVVGYILPLNYFTTVTGESLREYLQSNKYVSEIVDFGDALLFDDALTYTAISFFTKSSKSAIDYTTIASEHKLEDLDDSGFIEVKYSSLDSEKWRLLDNTEFENIQKIESFRPLNEVSDIHTGIATLKDDVYIIDVSDVGDEYYTITYSGKEYPIESGITEELVKISTIDDGSDLKNNNKRIILPYQKDLQRTLDGSMTNIGYDILDEDVLRRKFPKAYSYLQDVEDELATREKGGGADYSPWYKYGRKQGLEFFGERLYTPTYSHGPKFLHHSNETSLFSNGYAVFPFEIDISVLERVLNSKIMDYYIRKTSKEIQGDYQCYQKNFIKRFSIPEFSSKEKEELLSKSSQKKIDEFLIEKYGVDLEFVD